MGHSIIFIYTGLGLLLTAVFGVDVLNLISTDPYFNIGLFVLPGGVWRQFSWGV